MTTTSIHHRTCPLCEAVCGLEITLREGEVTRIAGDRADVFSRGFLCPKGATLQHLHADPDRLRAPLIRRGDDVEHARWEEVSWEAAFAEIERRLTPLRAQHGPDAVALYLGNPNSHTLAGSLYVRPLAKALGTRNVFSASTVDQMPKHVACGLMFGDPGAIPVPDLDRTQLLLMLGANPWESNGSLCTAPDFPGRIQALQARGGKFIVIDPRRTRSAQHADEHVPIRPGTDAHLLLAMLHVLFAESLLAFGRLAPWLAGIEQLRDAVLPFTPEAAARVSAVPADTIRRLARQLAATERAVVYGRIGTHTVEFGTLAAWAVDVLNALTGHLDAPGGAMWPLPAHAQRGRGRGRGFLLGRHQSRVRGYPEVRGELPVATLADEIETPGPGQVRALITIAGNPVLSTPNGARLSRVLRELECMVSIDPYRNETTRYAHVILPPPSALERSHYDLVFYRLAVRNVAKWSAPVLSGAAPSEADILARLALIAAGKGAAADPQRLHRELQTAALERATRDDPALAGRDVEELWAALDAEDPCDRRLEIAIRTGAYGDLFGARPEGLNFRKLRDAPHGIDLGPLEPRIPELLQTPSGFIELAPPPILDDLTRLARALESPPSDELLLVGRRDLRSNNSWMHNVLPLVKGPERCTLHIHPEDAAARGVQDGSEARVAARAGALVARVQLTDSVMRGVVSLPHGWGHGQPGAQQRVAHDHPGVNSNLLTDGERLDPLSGNAVLNGIPVSVEPA